MMKNSVKNINIGRYFGIRVYLHYSWFLVILFLSWVLATGWFPEKYSQHLVADYWILGVISSVLLFVSVLMHELSHSLVAKHYKIKVVSITLFFFGGVASLPEKKLEPKKELNMAIAGPLLSLALAGVFFVITKATDIFFISATSDYLFRINLIIALFNMIPGFPLDGGRVFRSLVWMLTNDFKKATKMATTGGKLLAYTLIFLGFANLFTGNYSGIYVILLGAFLLIVTTMGYEQVMLKELLGNRRVKDLMTAIKLKGDANFSTDRWETKGARIKVKKDMKAYDALTKMMKKDLEEAPVYDNRTIVGIIRLKDLIRAAEKKNKEELIKEKRLVEVET